MQLRARAQRVYLQRKQRLQQQQSLQQALYARAEQEAAWRQMQMMQYAQALQYQRRKRAAGYLYGLQQQWLQEQLEHQRVRRAAAQYAALDGYRQQQVLQQQQQRRMRRSAGVYFLVVEPQRRRQQQIQLKRREEEARQEAEARAPQVGLLYSVYFRKCISKHSEPFWLKMILLTAGGRLEGDKEEDQRAIPWTS